MNKNPLGQRRRQTQAPGSALPRIVLADDHEIVTEGLAALLEPDHEVVAKVHDGAELLAAARTLLPDVVIADISMPVVNGIDAIREIRQACPQTRAICLTMHADPTYVAEALAAGATGFVAKHAAPDELREALYTVLRGGTYVSRRAGGSGASMPRSRAPASAAAHALTPRQRQIVQLIAEGYTVKRAARALGVSPKTVEFHKYRAMRDLGIDSVAELVRYAARHGLAAD